MCVHDGTVVDGAASWRSAGWEAEVLEDLPRDLIVVDQRDEVHPTPTPWAAEHVLVPGAGEEGGPVESASPTRIIGSVAVGDLLVIMEPENWSVAVGDL